LNNVAGLLRGDFAGPHRLPTTTAHRGNLKSGRFRVPRPRYRLRWPGPPWGDAPAAVVTEGACHPAGASLRNVCGLRRMAGNLKSGRFRVPRPRYRLRWPGPPWGDAPAAVVTAGACHPAGASLERLWPAAVAPLCGGVDGSRWAFPADAVHGADGCSTSYPASFQAWRPPRRAAAFSNPCCRSSSTARALVCSALQVQ